MPAIITAADAASEIIDQAEAFPEPDLYILAAAKVLIESVGDADPLPTIATVTLLLSHIGLI